MIQSHCVSSPSSRDEYRKAPDDCRPLDQADGLDPLATKLHLPSLFIITQPESWYSFYNLPIEGRRLSWTRWDMFVELECAKHCVFKDCMFGYCFLSLCISWILCGVTDVTVCGLFCFNGSTVVRCSFCALSDPKCVLIIILVSVMCMMLLGEQE